jgi:hypothetical protein
MEKIHLGDQYVRIHLGPRAQNMSNLDRRRRSSLQGRRELDVPPVVTGDRCRHDRQNAPPLKHRL